MNEPFKLSRLSALSLLTIVIWIVAFIARSFLASVSYDIYSTRLGGAAYMAVQAGAKYLPADPRKAVQTADASARRSGITPSEIVFITVTPDDQTRRCPLRC